MGYIGFYFIFKLEMVKGDYKLKDLFVSYVHIA